MLVRATALESTVPVPRGADVRRVEYEDGRLVVRLEANGKAVATVAFESVEGFRVLDEGDLLEFWPTCSRPNGWLWQVHEGGWFALESTRALFLPEKHQGVHEFLVAGDNECVSVLSRNYPTVSANAL
jgi:hypothetical protein